MGLHPDEIGQFPYPDFVRYISYYTEPGKFIDGFMDEKDAMNKLTTHNTIQQDLIRRAEERKKQSKD